MKRLLIRNATHFANFADTPSGMMMARAFRRSQPAFKRRHIKPILQLKPTQVPLGEVLEITAERKTNMNENETERRHIDNIPQGTKVICNGYKGAIVRQYDGDTYEIRLASGVVATDDFELD